jgi:hypothetical protein
MLSSNSIRLVLLVAAAAFSAVTSAETETVDLGTAGDYVILTKTGISTVPDSAITGDIAVSPIAGTAMTGFSLTKHPGGKYSESSQFAGYKAYAADYDSPIPFKLTTAVSDMETAYLDCEGRDHEGAKVNLGAGSLGGAGGVGGSRDSGLTPGVYTFGTGVSIIGNIYFDGEGDPDSVFIIRMTGNLKQAKETQVILTGDALPKNIFWQVSGYVELGADAHLEGIVLVKTSATFLTGSSMNGRVLAQTRCDLQKATLTAPEKKAS